MIIYNEREKKTSVCLDVSVQWKIDKGINAHTTVDLNSSWKALKHFSKFLKVAFRNYYLKLKDKLLRKNK